MLRVYSRSILLKIFTPARVRTHATWGRSVEKKSERIDGSFDWRLSCVDTGYPSSTLLTTVLFLCGMKRPSVSRHSDHKITSSFADHTLTVALTLLICVKRNGVAVRVWSAKEDVIL